MIYAIHVIFSVVEHFLGCVDDADCSEEDTGMRILVPGIAYLRQLKMGVC